jgi:choline dehydrogenase-like flavoprotein
MSQSEEYDFIVCGAGTAGPVIAARLAEADPALSILIIEAGRDNVELENTQMVL